MENGRFAVLVPSGELKVKRKIFILGSYWKAHSGLPISVK